MRRMLAPALIGVFGAAILVALGVWQLQRLEWKNAILAEMQARIDGPPAALPEQPAPEADRYRPVAVTGRYLPGEIHVLTSVRGLGAGYRVIAPFETASGRRILVDRGMVPQQDKDAPRPLPEAPVRVSGNLHWPRESDGFTPEPDREANIWFAREGLRPQPVGTAAIPNDHLEYALTWFSLAAIWAGMTLLWLWRIRRRDE